MTNLDSVLKSRDITLLTKGYLDKSMAFPVVMYRCESWTIKKVSSAELMLLNCGAGEESWKSLDSKEIKPVNPKGNQSWIFIGTTDNEVEVRMLWPPGVKSWLIGKAPDARKVWGQVEKGATEDEMVRWHRWLNGHESEQTLGDSEGQGSLMCCSPWGCKQSDMTEGLNNNKWSSVCLWKIYI